MKSLFFVVLPFAVLLLRIPALAETIRLYLKDGNYQLAREYQVLQDRVKYLSAERGEWEELPLELVDLDRTKKEAVQREESLKREAKEQDEEDAAIRAEREEIARIPQEHGAYYIHGGKLEPLKQAEVKIVHDKKRNVLKIISPIPMVPGKSTVELDGATSQFRIAEDRPEFYFRLSDIEGFGIVKLTPKKTLRVVESVSVLQVTNETTEERQLVPTFKKEVGEQLFKIWPEMPLEPGEYALIEYTEGAVNPQIWDFSAAPAK
ncbi:MAG TPA: hypothetical protein VKV74_17435 [Bryobacteraceae bacterium]|nr:hypothetical protein [Bryobacteraceae bacterium]